MAGLSHWQSAMVWTWNLQQKLYRNQPGSALKRNSKVKRLRLSALAKKASISLAKHKLDTVEARVAFVLDASGSMTGQFKKGHVQAVLDRIAVLSVQFDDDGTMDVWGFAERHKKYPDVTLDNLDGYIAAIQNTGKRSAGKSFPALAGRTMSRQS
ncbi:VWA domain-containing protein [Klebsiella pneumoniae]|uniref:VWA domain-containing protein n=1 Tax=Klebsiella pneumoniae TaxID=573 RepID=A0A927DSL7_KLEPN|nr:VWA domain-containing protein [Klebsiella pneumoniae]